MAVHPRNWFGSRFPLPIVRVFDDGKNVPRSLLFGAKRSERRPHQRLGVMRRPLRYASLNSIFISRCKFIKFRSKCCPAQREFLLANIARGGAGLSELNV